MPPSRAGRNPWRGGVTDSGGASGRSALALLVSLASFAGPALAAEAALPSWADTTSTEAIVAFVDRVTTPGSPDYLPPHARIAAFDNDGTLWAEKPVYVQAMFILDRVRQLAPDHPEWRDEQPFAAVLAGDPDAALAGGKRGLLEMVMATHADTTAGEFSDIVLAWLATARHPTTGRPYTAMVYQPMLELLDYLRAHQFRTFIVSGGGIEFMRPWVQEVYGIPPEQVIGSSIRTTYEVREGEPVLLRQPELNFIDDGPGKPVGIHQHIGRRPVMAFGNSDGDFEMLEWTTSGAGPRMAVLVHHTDEEREWAYDRRSHVGRLSRGLDEAEGRGWVVIDMAADWLSIYPDPPDSEGGASSEE